MPILSEYEDLKESVRKMERRLNKEKDEQTSRAIKARLDAALARIAEIDRADEELHQRAMADHRAAEKERLQREPSREAVHSGKCRVAFPVNTSRK